MEYHIFWIQESSCFELFWDGKYGLLLIQKVDGRWYFLRHGIPFFLRQKSSRFDFSGTGNKVFFLSKKLIESLYFLAIFELFMIFQDLANMDFRVIMLSSNAHETINKFFQNLIKRCEKSNEDMEESRFSFEMSAALTLSLRK